MSYKNETGKISALVYYLLFAFILNSFQNDFIQHTCFCIKIITFIELKIMNTVKIWLAVWQAIFTYSVMINKCINAGISTIITTWIMEMFFKFE